MSYPLHTVDDAYDACHPETPLAVDDTRYVDLTAARGGANFSERLTNKVRRTKSPNFHQQLISGHRGCGKSTELLQLQTKLEKMDFFTGYIDVEEMLDLGDIQYFDLLFGLARGIADHACAAQLDINENLLAELTRWFAEMTVTEEHRADDETIAKMEASLEPKLPFLAKLLGSITAQFKNASSQRTEMRLKVTRDVTRFIERLYAFINDTRRAAKAKGMQDLVVIIDGLEKMQYREASEGESNYKELYIHHKEQLKAPHCHIF